MRHTLDGYNFLKNKSFDDPAQICITHLFPAKNLYSFDGKIDLSNEEIIFLKKLSFKC